MKLDDVEEEDEDDIAGTDEESREEEEEYSDSDDKGQKKSVLLGLKETARLPIFPDQLPPSTSVQIHPYSEDCQATPSPTIESDLVTNKDPSPSSECPRISPSSSLSSSSPKDNV